MFCCRKADRVYKCVSCGKYACSVCSATDNGKDYCIDCYIKKFENGIDLIIDEFRDMLNPSHRNMSSAKQNGVSFHSPAFSNPSLPLKNETK